MTRPMQGPQDAGPEAAPRKRRRGDAGRSFRSSCTHANLPGECTLDAGVQAANAMPASSEAATRTPCTRPIRYLKMNLSRNAHMRASNISVGEPSATRGTGRKQVETEGGAGNSEYPLQHRGARRRWLKAGGRQFPSLLAMMWRILGRCGSSSVGRASASQAEGRRFESGLPLHPRIEHEARPRRASSWPGKPPRSPPSRLTFWLRYLHP